MPNRIRAKLTILIIISFLLSYSVSVLADGYGEELKKHNYSGYIDYLNWAKGHDGLDAFIESLEKVNLDSLSESESKALLINAYNAGMIWLIIQNYPVEGVFEIKPKVFEQKAINIGGVMMSLDNIENDYLRKTGDHRIHFAIVCGSMGCPDLSAEVFKADMLDEQFDKAARNYLSQPKGLVIEKDPPVILLSMLFKWFGNDFGKTNAERLEVLSQYLSEEDAEFMLENANKAIVRYMDYDWSLNGD